MENVQIMTKGKVSVDKSIMGVDVINVINSITYGQHNHNPEMGTGSCKLCSCSQFKASTGGETCINHNSEGGTCNHRKSEHN